MTSLKERFEERFKPDENGWSGTMSLGTAEDILSFISSECERARGEGREEATEGIIGRIIQHSRGFDTISGKSLWHLDLDALEAFLTHTKL